MARSWKALEDGEVLTGFVVFVVSGCLIEKCANGFLVERVFLQQCCSFTRQMNSLNVGKLRFIISSLKGLSTQELGAELDRLCVGSANE